jgi:cysteine desulfurase / selenocysteine lyase
MESANRSSFNPQQPCIASVDNSQRFYLDHAATGWPKPPGVLEAVIDYQQRCGAAAGRGGYRASQKATRWVSQAREQIARLIGAERPGEVALVGSGTQALNLALMGLLRPGDHVVTTAIEHNSLLRPLAWLQQHRRIDWSLVGCDAQGRVDPQAVAAALRPQTRLVAISHVSNVTGAIQPLADIGQHTRKHGCWLLVDAAQSAGYLPIDVSQLPIDLLAAPGHKGLGGLLGTGFLWVSQPLQPHLQPLWLGGTGQASHDIEGPFEWPAGVEAGNPNVPGCVSLSAGLAWWTSPEGQTALQQLKRLTAELLALLKEHRWLTLHGPDSGDQRCGVFSVSSAAIAPAELSSLLETSFGIECRAGFHCAGRIHDELGTAPGGGTLRLSLGLTSRPEDLRQLELALEQLAPHFG